MLHTNVLAVCMSPNLLGVGVKGHGLWIVLKWLIWDHTGLKRLRLIKATSFIQISLSQKVSRPTLHVMAHFSFCNCRPQIGLQQKIFRLYLLACSFNKFHGHKAITR